MEFLNHVTVLAGLAVLVVQEVLKLKAVPVVFANRYPVPAAIALSLAASVFVVARGMVPLVFAISAWTSWVTLVVTVLLVATITYNMTIRNWAQLRAREGGE